MHALRFAEPDWFQLTVLAFREGFPYALAVVLLLGLGGLPILEAARGLRVRNRSDRVTVDAPSSWLGLLMLPLVAAGSLLAVCLALAAVAVVLDWTLPWLDQYFLSPYFSLPALTSFFVITLGSLVYLKGQRVGARLAGLFGALLGIGLVAAAFEWGMEAVYYGLISGIFALLALGSWSLRNRELPAQPVPVRPRTREVEPGVVELPRRGRRRRRLGRLRDLPGHALRGSRGSERIKLRSSR